MDRRLLLLVIPLLVGADVKCGPTAQEIGTTVLVSAPIVHAITVAVLWGLCALWRRREPLLRFPWRPHVGVTAALGVLGLAWAHAFDIDLLFAAIAIFGSAYLTITVLVWRIAFAMRRDARAFLLPSLAAIPICVGPALALATGQFDDHATASDMVIGLWGILGGGGIVTAAVVIPCAIEAWWRGRPRIE
jgi:hypothetical protein